jgi:hypothetical protein
MYMKNGIIAQTALTIAAVMLFTSCGETYMEEHQNAYKATDVVPIVLGVTGPTTVMQTEIKTYTPSYNRAGSTWSWSTSGATLQSVSSDTRTATVEFNTYPPSGIATITVSETTSGGIKSPDKIIDIAVIRFCEFDINNFTGAFSCDEAGYGIYAVNFTKDPVLANTIINDNFWDWAAPGAVIKYTLSGDFDQIVTVPRQDFEFGDGYVGWVEGSGIYDGCDYTMTVNYIVYYEGDEYATYQTFSPAKKGMIYPILQKKSRGNIR